MTRGVAASTQNQALNAVVFLYRDMICEHRGGDRFVAFGSSQ